MQSSQMCMDVGNSVTILNGLPDEKPTLLWMISNASQPGWLRKRPFHPLLCMDTRWGHALRLEILHLRTVGRTTAGCVVPRFIRSKGLPGVG